MKNTSDLYSLWKEQRFDEALALVRELLKAHPDCPYMLVRFGILILLTESADLSLEDAEKAFLRAIEVAPHNLDALEELAHYYDVHDPDRVKAQHFAERYIKQATEPLEDMQHILQGE